MNILLETTLKTSDLFSWMVTKQMGKGDFATSKGYINLENLAWNVATSVRSWHNTLFKSLEMTTLQSSEDNPIIQPETDAKLLDTPATVAQLDKWLSVESGLFRHKALGKNYLASGDNPYNDNEWNASINKGHLFAIDFEPNDDDDDDDHDEDVPAKKPKYIVQSKDLVFGEPRSSDFRNIGIIDYTAPGQSQVNEILSHTEFATGPKGKVYMHCAGGWGRTGMGLLLCIIYLFNVSWNSALTIMYQLYTRQSVEEVEQFNT